MRVGSTLEITGPIVTFLHFCTIFSVCKFPQVSPGAIHIQPLRG